MEKAIAITSRQIAVLVALLVLAAWIGTCQWRASEERRRAEEIATAQGLAQVVKATFAGRTDLKVSSVSGTIDVTSVNRGTIFDSKLKATLPFSVDYFVDLSGLGADDARYDPSTKTLSIEIPEVRIADPNIDLTKGKVGSAEGFWVSRRASANLVNRAVRLTRQKATQTAREPQHYNRAKEEARTRIAALLDIPLEATRYEDVSVVVRFASEGAGDPSYLDRSLSYNQAMEEARRRREGSR